MRTCPNLNYAIIAIASVLLVACTSDPLEVPAPQAETMEIENPDYEIIRSLGWQTEGIAEEEDLYVVEGDVLLTKAYIDSLKRMPETRQARVDDGIYGIITGGRENGIRVKITSNNLPDPAWRKAVREAIDIWNAVPNCSVYFYKIETEILPHNVRVYMRNKPSVADATPPNFGTPGDRIRINSNIDWYNDTHEKKVYILVHEFGHILGLAHTDYVWNYEENDVEDDNPSKNRHISGTPLTEYESVMYSHSAGRRWGDWERNWGSVWDPDSGWISSPNALVSGRFTNGDILAIQKLYGNPDYSVNIVGPETLFPGVTTTYNLEIPALLQDYVGSFDPPIWTSSEQIVSRTNTSVTIKCNSGVLRPITVNVSCVYNGVTMTDSFTINEAQANNCQGLRQVLGYQGFSTAQITTIMSGGTYAQWRQAAKNLNVIPSALVDYIFDRPNDPINVNLKNYLSISGANTTVLNANVTYSTPATLPAGITFKGWSTPTGGTYQITGGLTSRNLVIKFNSASIFTLTANFTLPGNVTYSTSKVIDLRQPATPDSPVLSIDKSTASPGNSVKFTVQNSHPDATYEWDLIQGETMWASSNFIHVYCPQEPFEGSYPWYLIVRCRATINGASSNWSNEYYAMLDYLAPATMTQRDSLNMMRISKSEDSGAIKTR